MGGWWGWWLKGSWSGWWWGGSLEGSWGGWMCGGVGCWRVHGVGAHTHPPMNSYNVKIFNFMNTHPPIEHIQSVTLSLYIYFGWFMGWVVDGGWVVGGFMGWVCV